MHQQRFRYLRPLVAGLCHLDAIGAEWVDLTLAGIGDRFVRAHLGKRGHLSAEVLGRLSELLFKVAVFVPAASRNERRRSKREGEAASHFLPFDFADERRCAATSSSSR